jgi:hypothetical protein
MVIEVYFPARLLLSTVSTVHEAGEVRGVKRIMRSIEKTLFILLINPNRRPVCRQIILRFSNGVKLIFILKQLLFPVLIFFFYYRIIPE